MALDQNGGTKQCVPTPRRQHNSGRCPVVSKYDRNSDEMTRFEDGKDGRFDNTEEDIWFGVSGCDCHG